MRLAWLTVVGCVVSAGCGGATDSKNAVRLTGLEVSVGQLVPAFSPEQTEYELEEDHLVANVVVKASAGETAIIALDGVKTVQPSDGRAFDIYLAPGDQEITLSVSEPGFATGVYQVRATRSATLAQTYVKAEEPVTFREFGRTVSCSPGTLAATEFIADSPRSIRIFAGTDMSTLTQQAKLDPDPSNPKASFVGAALDGDTLAAVQSTTDSAELFRRSADVWQVASTLGTIPVYSPLPALALSKRFLALDSGLPGKDEQVVLFDRDPAASGVVTLRVPGSAGAEGFGASVALSDSVLVVGAPNESSAAGASLTSKNLDAPDSGAAYVFELDAGGTWQLKQFLKASDASPKGGFGTSVSANPNQLIIGADGQSGSGAIYVFERAQGTWTEAARLTRRGAKSDDALGSSVALGHGIVAAGSHDASSGVGIDPTLNDDGAPASGAVHVFERRPEGWTEIHLLKSLHHPMKAPETFGVSVAVCDGTLVVGAPFDSSRFGGVRADPGNDESYLSGAVWVFR